MSPFTLHSDNILTSLMKGGGGKGTWGRLLDTDGESHLNWNDLNHDRGKEPYQLVGSAISDPLDDYKKAVAVAATDVKDLGTSEYHPHFVKINLSEGSSRGRAFKFQSDAAEEGLVSSSQMVKGFGRLSEALDDLSLDIPSAKVLFFESLVPKAISGGWLNSSFLISFGENGDAKGEDTEKVKHFKEEAVTIIHENSHSDDMPELIHSLEELAAPEFYPVFLKKLITLAMDRINREKEMASVLVSALHTEIFSSVDTVCGFVLLLETAKDTALDASNELALFLAKAVIDDRLLRCWAGGTGWAVEDGKDKITKLLEYESRGVVAEASTLPNAEDKFGFYVDHAKNNEWLLSSFTAYASPDMVAA
ncbi:hypothetical protein MKW92_039435 [Papaver armeniacum]|nr:hypothetical protein MKW92_039435 [Papaver armeniacum]